MQGCVWSICIVVDSTKSDLVLISSLSSIPQSKISYELLNNRSLPRVRKSKCVIGLYDFRLIITLTARPLVCYSVRRPREKRLSVPKYQGTSSSAQPCRLPSRQPRVSFLWMICPKLLIFPNLPGTRPRHTGPYRITLTIESRLEWLSTLLEFLVVCHINLKTKNTKRGSSPNTVLLTAFGISLVHLILFCLE